ncbi:MAG: LCP family protein [Acidimicrobiia bacterium]
MTNDTNPEDARPSRGGPAAIASSLLPGWGHVLVGERRIGWTLLAVDVLALALLAMAAIWFPADVLGAWVTPAALALIVTANLGVLAYRAVVTADAFRRAGRRGIVDWAGLVVAAAVVVVPHLAFGGLVATQQDLLTSVFATDEPGRSTTSTAPASTTVPQSTVPDSDASTTTTTVPATTTTTEPPRIWDGRERLNILLLGSDAGVGRIGTRTDTMILVSVEPESGDTAMFSIPRNLTEAPLPDGMGLWSCNCFPDILAHLWANGEWYPEAFPGPQAPSVNALKAAVGLTFGVDVHYYAKVDLAGFVGIVDAVGGVTIDVPERLVDEEYPHEEGGTEFIVFEEGTQELDGHRALAYARIRRHSGDFARMHRQRCVLGALAEQTSPLDLLRGYDEFATAVKEYVETDIPVDRLADFVDLLTRVDTGRLASLRITSYNYGESGHAGYQIYDLDRLRADARALMDDPTRHLATQDGLGFDDTCTKSFD